MLRDPEEEPAEIHLARTQAPANIVLFSDTDFQTDRLWVQVAQFQASGSTAFRKQW